MDIAQDIGILLIVVGIVYSIYQFPILLIGYLHFHDYDIDFDWDNYKPLVSIIVPAKNEETVIGRCIESILSQAYDNFELFVVVDNSDDDTYRIAKSYERDGRVHVFERHGNLTKASALNYAYSMSHGEIIATYDADTVLEKNTLKNAVYGMRYMDADVLQGYNTYINREENIFTRLAAIDEIIVKVSMIGRMYLHLFVPVAGSNQYFKRETIRIIGGWNGNFLTEDLESGVRMAAKRMRSAYLPSAKVYQETPATYSEYIKQRIRWLRGYHQVLLHSKKELSGLSGLDILMIVLAPTFSGILLFSSIYISILNFYNPYVHSMRTYFISLLFIFFMIYIIAFVLALIKKKENALYIPLVYIYVVLNAIISIYTFFLEILGVKRVWYKVKKTGKTTM
ncbi:glycosyltransferase [Picrophilus oshimae]|uniref:Glycosyltransferase, catalytic subunit of cellulose synthase and poly-beta-1,6-N-acetylglucosamine synthase n=1 Tax=Picrophilus torridus (strain ATCC 700027 / DSM 9790 / JCM 10055 / NBRC 100828 / KAW 2/3) TaxID=1122961 RepID=A0A8G2L8F3_PICTO|nr:glycosyltransferase [Picrophilus oshimae]SMD31380.1 Glycosyltransferase, catalytic subunit of cellulose synthase and poly-beta-1,6-N-acetylglucosamine synthase [Picrophilus oshimae DSM 9789]